MSSGLSEVDIANMALDLLEEEPITSLSGEETPAKWMNRNFTKTRDAVLRAHPWNFALTRVELSANATAPAFGWDYRFAVPSDNLRILPLRQDGKINGAHYPHEVEGGYILTNAIAPLKVRYIRRVTDTGEFDILFAEALSSRLASKMAHLVTGKASQVASAVKMYRAALFEARVIDGLEGTPEDPDDSDILDARL